MNILSLVLIAVFLNLSVLIYACDDPFEGFGIHLGSIDHFANSPNGTVQKVIDKVYDDLLIRHYRTSYESTFSPIADVYEIVCSSIPRICSWIEVLESISSYNNISVMASIWSPPRRMKTILNTLPTSQERNFHYFINNVTKLIYEQFNNLTIERISPVNEPENLFAAWEHLTMLPQQLCRMVRDFNDSTISICPESSYFTTSLLFSNTSVPACLDTCEVFGTHAYELTIDEDSTFRAHYDLTARDRTIPSHIPIWQTEVCTTYAVENNQMQDALDLAINIVNFVGHTCVQRYYFWLSYTLNPSGESLIWGDRNGVLTLPKKYFAYRHFTWAAFKGAQTVEKYDPITGTSFLTFGKSKAVFVNNRNSTQTANWTEDASYVCLRLICTTDLYDWNLLPKSITIDLPAKSVCSCTLKKNKGNQ